MTTSLHPDLDPLLNTFPATARHIHLMGICGTGMASLAGLLKQAGFKVTGSDLHAYPPMSDFLAGAGIKVALGYSADNLTPRPDLVVVGNVISRTNDEAQALAGLRIPYVSFPQALRHFFLAGKTSLVVAGTHGKTTTSALLAHALHVAGLEPGFMIGGLVHGFGRNYNLGSGSFFVVEGDEYDTAFFDKGPKFLHYQPEIAILTSVEFDHADIYADFAAVKEAFSKLVRIMPPQGCLVACLDHAVVRELTSKAPCRLVGYGEAADLMWSVREIEVAEATTFTVYRAGVSYGSFRSPLPGRHNALNALAVIAVLDNLGLAPATIERALASFPGVRRRQEVRGEVGGVTVIDDFAHHPTAVRETLIALKAAYRGRRLVAVFEPRTNSSRRNVFQRDYVESFDAAEVAIIREPPALEKIPVAERFSSRRLVADLLARGMTAHFFEATDEILSFLSAHCRPGDVIAILSNGGFDNIHERLLTLLQTGADPGASG